MAEAAESGIPPRIQDKKRRFGRAIKSAIAASAATAVAALPLSGDTSPKPHEVSPSSYASYFTPPKLDTHYPTYEITPTKGDVHEPSLQLSPEALGLGREIDNKRSYPVLEIVRDATGNLAFKDASSQGVPETTREWFGDALDGLKPFLGVALQGGADSIKIYASSTQLDNFVPTEHVIDLNVGLTGRLNPLDFRELLVHEASHALFAERPISITNAATPTKVDQEAFQNACQVIRRDAAQTVAEQFDKLQPYMKQLVNTQPEFKSVFDEITTAVRNGELDTLYPITSGDSTLSEIGNSVDKKAPTCEFISISQAVQEVENRMHKQIYDMSGELPEMDKIFTTILRHMSLYSIFTDSNYQGVYAKAGHPWTNLEEVAASMTELTITDPRLFGEKIRRLPSDQRDAVLTMHALIMQQLFKIHNGDKLQPYLEPRINALRKAAGVENASSKTISSTRMHRPETRYYSSRNSQPSRSYQRRRTAR